MRDQFQKFKYFQKQLLFSRKIESIILSSYTPVSNLPLVAFEIYKKIQLHIYLKSAIVQKIKIDVCN